MFKNTNKAPNNAGFTLFEMVVVVLIISIITIVLLASYPQFGNRVSLAGLIRETALIYRTAQVYGLGVREFPPAGEVFPPFGVFIDQNGISNNEFIVFGDYCGGGGIGCDPGSGILGDPDGLYNIQVSCTDEGTECLERFTIPDNARIADVCAGDFSGTPACASDEDPNFRLDITFNRPDPEARILLNGINQGPDPEYDWAKVCLSTDRFPDEKKIVRIWNTGQIAILDSNDGEPGLCAI